MSQKSPEFCDLTSLNELPSRRNLPTILAMGAVAIGLGSSSIAEQQAYASPARGLAVPTGITEPLRAYTSTANKKECTSLRFSGLYVIMGGRTCRQDGAKADTVSNGYPSHGWIYSVVKIDGVTKCGYIQPDVLPSYKAPKSAIGACKKYRTKIVAREYITEPNCGDINGVDSCKDATWYSPTTESCSSNGMAFTHFATKGKSPWNVFGVKARQFSRPLSEEENSSVKYRAEFKVRGPRAIVVRTKDGWGVQPENCVAPNNRYGGTCAKKRSRDEKGNTVCGSSDEVRKDAKNWRKLVGPTKKLHSS